MSTKYFAWDGGAEAAIATLNYSVKAGGNPVEGQHHNQPVFAVQGWHALSDVDRAIIVARFTAAGWVELPESKPDQERQV